MGGGYTQASMSLFLLIFQVVLNETTVCLRNLQVGPHCMLGEGSEMGDKCSIKRSVGHCHIGSGVKVMETHASRFSRGVSR